MIEGQEFYSHDDCEFYEDCPFEAAMRYFNYNGHDGEVIQIYSGVSYIPTNQDEMEWMEGEGHEFCIKDVKPYAKFRYDEKNNDAIEVEE